MINKLKENTNDDLSKKNNNTMDSEKNIRFTNNFIEPFVINLFEK